MIVAYDLETFRFGLAQMAPRPVCVGTHDNDGDTCLYHFKEKEGRSAGQSVMGALLHAAKSKAMTIVGHNVAYDNACIAAHCPDLIPLIFEAYDADGITDTMLRQKLLDIAHGCYRGWANAATEQWIKHDYRLDSLVKRLLGRDMPKDAEIRTTFSDLYDLPISKWPPAHVEYAKGDAVGTYDVYQHQEGEAAKEPGVLVDQFRQARAAFALQLASVWGMRTSREGVQALYDATQARVDQIKDSLIDEGLLRANGSRNMKAAFARMEAAFPECPETPTGRPQITNGTCEESGDAALVELSAYTKAQNILSKDVKELAHGVAMPIHTYFDTLMTTGRVSSSRPNFQNFKRQPGVRDCFVPREGHLFCSCDFDKAELCTLAEVCYTVFGHSRLGDRLNEGFDPHLDMGAQMLGTTYEYALQNKSDPEVQKARQGGKIANFGLPGGMGVNGLIRYAKNVHSVSMNDVEAEFLIQHWKEAWPEMSEYLEWIRRLCGNGLATIKQLFSDRVRGMITYTVAANGFFQGLAADAIKAALWDVSKKQYVPSCNPLYGTRTVNIPHDELIVEVPDDPELAHAAAMELQKTMVDAFQLWTPHVKITAEASLMRKWIKKAEPVYKDGLLIPWEES